MFCSKCGIFISNEGRILCGYCKSKLEWEESQKLSAEHLKLECEDNIFNKAASEIKIKDKGYYYRVKKWEWWRSV